MNKGRRKELMILKYKTRLRNYRLPDNGAHYSFKSSGKPCSCFVCSTNKYKRNGAKKQERNEIQFQINSSLYIYCAIFFLNLI